MKDQFGRELTYLRLSVMDRCNLKCMYCMPAHGIVTSNWKEMLTYKEMAFLVQCFAELGINKVRITGGEPLLRPDIAELLAAITNTPGISKVAMSTNGVFLKKYAHALMQAGLNQINISLDTLRPDRFKWISKLDQLQQVLDGIDDVISKGLKTIKLNTVLMHNFNNDEILDLVRYAVDQSIEIRFIELMPTNAAVQLNVKDHFMATEEAKQIIEKEFALESFETHASSPARVFKIKGTASKVGFISPLSNFFCKRCNRLRLKANGMMKTCLHGPEDLDLKTMVRTGRSRHEIKEKIKQVVFVRPEQHFLNVPEVKHNDFQMSQVGG